MRRMLDPKEVGGGGLPSTITFDEEGNRTVGKNLGVDGKLTLKSLVSASNPDGDITKELGGGGGGGGGGSQIHGYSVIAGNTCHYEIYTTEDYDWMTIGEATDFSNIFMEDQYKALRAKGTYPAAGYSASDDMYVYEFYINENNEYSLKGYSFKMKSYISTGLQSLSSLRRVVSVIKLF